MKYLMRKCCQITIDIAASESKADLASNKQCQLNAKR